MNTIELPALDGRLPLGFLAACGTLRLLDESAPSGSARPLLSWDRYSGTAVLTIDADLDGVVERLQGVAASVPEGSTIPGLGPGFPPRAGQTGGDPLRMQAVAMRDRAIAWRSTLGQAGDDWLPALITDLAPDEQGRVGISPMAAPFAKQTFETLFAKSLGAVLAHSGSIRDALVGWRRVDGVTGEYLDHQAVGSSADRPDGISVAGVPGATWLAVMSLPLFPVTSNDGRPRAAAWQRISAGVTAWAWPLWSPPIDMDAVAVAVTHPALRATGLTRGGELRVNTDRLRPLGVFAVAAARRTKIVDKHAGVLTPLAVASGE